MLLDSVAGPRPASEAMDGTVSSGVESKMTDDAYEFSLEFSVVSNRLEEIAKEYFLAYLDSGVAPGLAALVRGLAVAVPLPATLTMDRIVDALVEPTQRQAVRDLCRDTQEVSSRFGIVLPGITETEAAEILDLLAYDYDHRSFPTLTEDDGNTIAGIVHSVALYSQRSVDHARRVRAALVSTILSRSHPVATVF
jgi:hypothetical protein